jgi:hypothetical protein
MRNPFRLHNHVVTSVFYLQAQSWMPCFGVVTCGVDVHIVGLLCHFLCIFHIIFQIEN